MYIAAFCVNTKVLKEKGLPMPKGWNDLLDPKLKGLIAMRIRLLRGPVFADCKHPPDVRSKGRKGRWVGVPEEIG